jgi:Peptidase family M23
VHVCGEKLRSHGGIVKDGNPEMGVLNVSPNIGRIRAVRVWKSNVLRRGLLALGAGVAGFLAMVAMRMDRVVEIDGDTPLEMPAQSAVDHRFHFLSAWETAQIPRALRFDPPMGSDQSGLIYNAQKFWEMNEKRGGYHTGDDLNGIGGMNTDLGDPVFCTADGRVLYAGEPSPGWGNLVIIGHHTVDGKLLHSMYAHLLRIDVAKGELIARGGKLGLVGTANGYYPAHLHFEMRSSDGVDIGAGYASTPLYHLDPTGTVNSLRNATADDLSASPLLQVLK